MPEYFHHDGGLNNPPGLYVDGASKKVFAHGGIEVIAVQHWYNGIPFTGVAHFRSELKPFAGIPISDVAELNGLQQSVGLERTVRAEGFKGKIVSLLQPSKMKPD